MRQGFFEDLEGGLDFLFGDVEGREKANGFGAGGGNEEPVFKELMAEVDGGDFVFGCLEVFWVESDS